MSLHDGKIPESQELFELEKSTANSLWTRETYIRQTKPSFINLAPARSLGTYLDIMTEIVEVALKLFTRDISHSSSLFLVSHML